jgi:hypothetical protein
MLFFLLFFYIFPDFSKQKLIFFCIYSDFVLFSKNGFIVHFVVIKSHLAL